MVFPNFCHKLWYVNPFIFATWCCKPMIFQTLIICKQGFKGAHLLLQLWTFSHCIHCKTNKKDHGFYKKKFRQVSKFTTHSLGSRDVPHKIWAWSVLPLWRLFYWKQTNKQTSKVIYYILKCDLIVLFCRMTRWYLKWRWTLMLLMVSPGTVRSIQDMLG